MRWHRFILASSAYAIGTLGLLTAAGAANAASLAGSGEGLQLLRKIQGTWQGACSKPKGADVYQMQALHFSFTHLRQRIRYFSDSSCVREIHDQTAEYRFALHEPVETSSDMRAYAINLQAEGDSSPSKPLHPANIIHYSDGVLLLGRGDDLDPSLRLTALDTSNLFRRP